MSTFKAHYSINIFIFPGIWTEHFFFLRYSLLNIWPWKFKAKVMAKVKIDGDIWGLASNQYFIFFSSIVIRLIKSHNEYCQITWDQSPDEFDEKYMEITLPIIGQEIVWNSVKHYNISFRPVVSYDFINQFWGKFYNQFETAWLIRGQEMGEFNWSQPKVNPISVVP